MIPIREPLSVTLARLGASVTYAPAPHGTRKLHWFSATECPFALIALPGNVVDGKVFNEAFEDAPHTVCLRCLKEFEEA